MKNKNTFEKILEPAIPMIKEIQQTLNGDSDKYTLSFTEFTTNLFFGIFSKIKSVSQMITEIKTSPNARKIGLVNASKSMYSEAFRRYKPDLFRKIFIYLLQSCNFLCIPEINQLGRIFVVDGSLFPAVSKMTWAGYKKCANAVKLHMSFSLNRMIPVNFLISEGKYSEKKFLASAAEDGSTYICDKGYVSFEIFKYILDAGAYFIIRGKSNLKFSVKELLTADIPVEMMRFFKNISDSVIVLCNDAAQNVYRIVKFEAMGETYILITNRFDLSSYEIIMLYAYRWQVELCFRFLKRTFNGIHLLSHSPGGVQVQFYLFMIAYILLIHFKQICVSSRERESETEKNAQNSARRPQQGRIYACGLVSLLGGGLKKFWKINLSWLISMKNFLAEPFSGGIIENLNAAP